jgi:hypothetical protein
MILNLLLFFLSFLMCLLSFFFLILVYRFVCLQLLLSFCGDVLDGAIRSEGTVLCSSVFGSVWIGIICVLSPVFRSGWITGSRRPILLQSADTEPVSVSPPRHPCVTVHVPCPDRAMPLNA